MTTELTLREKVRQAVSRNAGYGHLGDAYACDLTMDIVAMALEATGAPAYIGVADDLRGAEPARDTDVTLA